MPVRTEGTGVSRPRGQSGRTENKPSPSISCSTVPSSKVSTRCSQVSGAVVLLPEELCKDCSPFTPVDLQECPVYLDSKVPVRLRGVEEAHDHSSGVGLPLLPARLCARDGHLYQWHRSSKFGSTRMTRILIQSPMPAGLFVGQR